MRHQMLNISPNQEIQLFFYELLPQHVVDPLVPLRLALL